MLEQGFAPEKDISAKELEKLKEISFSNLSSGLSIDVHVNPKRFENNLRTKINDY